MIAQSGYAITDKLYAESDLILQGEIEYIECLLNDIGTGDCMYILSVDSVFKGKPRIYPLSNFDIKMYRKQTDISLKDLDTKVDAITFTRSCPFYLNIRPDHPIHIREDCFSIGDTIIVFLKDTKPGAEYDPLLNNTRYAYHVIDQWAGILYPSSYLSAYLRRLASLK